MKLPYIDLHTHTCLSDGAVTPEELTAEAERCGVGILAITDHNRPADLTGLRLAHPRMRLIQGAEISCMYTDPEGAEHELHVVALGFDPNHPAMQEVFRQNQPDRRPYIEAILGKLAKFGIDVGTYDSLCAAENRSSHVGRMHIAKAMVERGYVKTVDEAFDIYLGVHGQKLCYTPNPLRYVTLEQAVAAILAAGGVAVLAHLYYYCLSDKGNHDLLAYFSRLTNGRGAMETEYSIYDRQTRDGLAALAKQYGLMASCASDYHGLKSDETMDHRFPAEICRDLMACLNS